LPIAPALWRAAHRRYYVMINTKQLAAGRRITVERVRDARVPETLEPHRHNYYEIFWVLQGEGQHRIDLTDCAMRPAQMHLIFPGQVHHVQRVPEDLYAISFLPEMIGPDLALQRVLERLFHIDGAGACPLRVSDEDCDALTALLGLIEAESAVGESELLRSLFSAFLHFISRYADRQVRAAQGDKRVACLPGLIESYFRQRHDTGFYADALALSSKRLNEITRRQLNQTVTQMIHARLMLEAKRELAFTDASIKVIGLNLGFNDIAYFCRFFKRLAGVSPMQYRDSAGPDARVL